MLSKDFFPGAGYDRDRMRDAFTDIIRQVEEPDPKCSFTDIKYRGIALSAQRSQSIFPAKHNMFVPVERCILKEWFIFQQGFYLIVEAIAGIEGIEPVNKLATRNTHYFGTL